MRRVLPLVPLKIAVIAAIACLDHAAQPRHAGALEVHKCLKNRDASVRKKIALSDGGSEASEAAVDGALKWLANHQDADGSWSFDHTGGDCGRQCGNPGKLRDAKFAATGLALLTFLGRGETHQQGAYQPAIKEGLYYLATNMNLTPKGADLTGGGGAMYGQAIATVALAEAHALARNDDLVLPAQKAIDYIEYAQDPIGGGWDYAPRSAGDTSITGWQVMALRSGLAGSLAVHKHTMKLATKFLDSVQADGGAEYGYREPGGGPATSAEGLLCRMWLGWEHDKPELRRGVEKLAAIGPKKESLYFTYYATSALHQFDAPDGELWKTWNAGLRDMLVNEQKKAGHESGSWMFAGTDYGNEPGGRLYCTTLAAMTLEVYYRYAPIYQKPDAEAK